MGALVFHLKFERVLKAKHRLFKCQTETHLDITPTTWTALLLLATAKELAKDVTKASITKIKVNVLTLKTTKPFERITALPAATAGCTANTCMTKLVIALAFLFVLQDLVGFVNLFKLRLITTLFIGVMFDGSLAKRLLQLVITGVFIDA